ncbi:hypothetical protein L596_026387 [Steinernema carpocapsae]|uniref:Uncharacterized protein n=1 Tax=Steinernema carpocapsae TaxID=34508 RepID=A0A4U5M170_STECR|nr:hypothetical protein L596_026387 [Steinernema carpocapsae]
MELPLITSARQTESILPMKAISLKRFFIRYELNAFAQYVPGSSSTIKKAGILSALLITASINTLQP